MQNIRFYREYTTPQRTTPTGNVVAVYLPTAEHHAYVTGTYQAFCALLDEPNSPVTFSHVAVTHIETHCKRISEAMARTIHPALFDRLDNPQ